MPTASIIGRTPDWFPDWRGETCALIASGPSAKKAKIELLRGKVRAIAINESYRLCMWADALYACDAKWWNLRAGVAEFHGLKIGFERQPLYSEIKYVHVERYSNEILLKPGTIGAGGNSGFQALNLAVQFGASRILLVGYDMRVDLGEHWHKRHEMPLSNPHPHDNLPRWRAAIDGARTTLQSLGIEVVNCSPVSALIAYPKRSLEECI